MTKRSFQMGLLAAAMAVALVVAATALTSGTAVQAQQAEEGAIVVGTYNAQAAFEQHPAQAEFKQSIATLQDGMREAQQEGDNERVQQLQQEYEQERTQAVEQFHQDVETAVPDAASKAGVQVVAEQVVYTADNIETKDITADVVDAFPAGSDGQPEPAQPGVQEIPAPQQ
ncbi:MAG: hypothetical protein ACLFTT_02500 [Candidatus Hydrogenedentota bacterium]